MGDLTSAPTPARFPYARPYRTDARGLWAQVRDLKLDAERIFLAQGTLRPDLIESGSNLAYAPASQSFYTLTTRSSSHGVSNLS